jgi:putative membrane protein
VTENWQIPRRQPGTALLLVLYKTIVQLIRMLWPLLLIWVLRSPGRQARIDPWEIAIGATSILFLLHSILEFYRFRFSIEADELIIRKGIFTRTQLVLPLHRIQAVHIEENWLHQLLDLAQVALDSPGTEKTEVKLILKQREAEEFRRYISGQQRQADPALSETARPEPDAEPTLFQLSQRDLIRLGLSANHLEAFFLMLAFGFSLLDNLERAIDFEFSGFLRWLSDLAANSTAAALGMVALAILLLSIVLSLLRITLQYGRFAISRSAKGFRIQSGLINLKEKIIPFSKVQYISWKANWLRSRIPIYLLHFHAIGDENMKKKWTIRIPITQPGFVDTLLAYYHPAINQQPDYLRIQRAYIWRRVWLLGILPLLLLFPLLYYFRGAYAFWLLPWPIYIALTASLFRRRFRLYLAPDALQICRGIFGREYIVLRWENIQSMALRQSIYQRRHGLATLRIYTADRWISIPFLTVQEAEIIRDYAMARVEMGEVRGNEGVTE